MVSVCLATYNGSKYIKQQIESILNQLESFDEIVISDDSSTDNTIEIVKSFKDARIRILEKNTFRDPAKNFQNALVNSLGDFIFLCDQDDVWLPNKIEILKRNLRTFDLVTSDCRIVDTELSTVSESYFKLVDAKEGFFRNIFLKTSPYIGCCMAFKKNVMAKALPFPSKIINHDYWIAMIAEAYFKVSVIHTPLVLYRRHSANVSNTGNKSTNSLYAKLNKRIYIIYHIIKRLFK